MIIYKDGDVNYEISLGATRSEKNGIRACCLMVKVKNAATTVKPIQPLCLKSKSLNLVAKARMPEGYVDCNEEMKLDGSSSCNFQFLFYVPDARDKDGEPLPEGIPWDEFMQKTSGLEFSCGTSKRAITAQELQNEIAELSPKI